MLNTQHPPVTIHPQLQHAHLLSEQNLLDEAEIIYHSILKMEPDEAHALHGLGVIRAKQGLTTEALQFFDQALNQIDNDPKLYIHRGHAFRALEEWEKALESYNQALKYSPSHEEALCYQGHLFQQINDFKSALASYETALSYHLHSFQAWYGRGNALLSLDQLEEALESYTQALHYQPDYAPAWNNRGAILQALKRYAEAIVQYEQALQINPQFVDALYNSARTYQVMHQFEQALPFFDRVIALKPDYADAFNYRGVSFYHTQQYEKALNDYSQAILLNPNYPQALNNKGAALHALNQSEEAILCYQHALVLAPNYVEALYNQGNTLLALERKEEALACFNAALAIKPDYLDAVNNKGAVLHKLNRLEEALAVYQSALDIQTHSQLLYNCANLFIHLNHPQKAIEHYEQAITLQNDDFNALNDAYFNKGICELLLGRLEEGWKGYEWRFHVQSLKGRLGPTQHYYDQQPAWTGQEDIQGKTILLHVEQGLGDIMQFCRYIPLLLERGANVILEIPLILQSLLSSLPWDITITLIGNPPPSFDHHISLLSLPYAFGTTLATIPSPIPYLSAPAERILYWKNKLSRSKKSRIGLVWSGNKTHTNDKKRSIALKIFMPLLSSKYTFYCLQKEIREEDQATLQHSPIYDFSTVLDNFSETAALMSQLDLVITVDTSVAHLAGAMGKPVWILLPYMPDWRWMLNQDNTPWYPSARLFRQRKEDDWDSVIEAVQNTLRTFFT
jgi:tetratricopeptide (TPR) repeat protein